MYDETYGIRWDPTLPALARVEFLTRHAEQHNLRNFVETGTASGDTCAWLNAIFDHLYTVEIVPTVQAQAAARLSQYPNVWCYLGDSTDIIPIILDELDGPALFWLDGHYCGSEEARGVKDTPVIEELEAILATGQPHHIFIDDARIFGRDPAWPTLEEIRHIGTSQDRPFAFSYHHDILCLVP